MSLRGGYMKIWLGASLVTASVALGTDPVSGQLALSRKDPAKLTVSWDGLDYDSLVGNPFIQQNVLLTWELGFDDGEVLTDVFVIKETSVGFGESISFSVTAYDKSIELAERVSRKVYKNVRASDLAIEFAREIGVAARVTESNIVHESVSTVGATFGQTLRAMAVEEDFDFHVTKDTLYFGPANLYGKPTRRLYYHTTNGVGPGSLLKFNIKRDAVALVSALDRDTKTKGKDGETKTGGVAKDTGIAGGSITSTRTFVAGPGASSYEASAHTEVVVDAAVFQDITEEFKDLPGYSQETTRELIRLNQDLLRERIEIIQPLKDSNPEWYNRQLAEAVAESNTKLEEIRAKITTQNAKQRQVVKRTNDARKIVDRLPLEDAVAAAIRNESRARLARWKSIEASGDAIGVMIRPRERMLIEGVLEQFRGPWLVESSNLSYADGEISVNFSTKTEPPETKDDKDKAQKQDAKTNEAEQAALEADLVNGGKAYSTFAAKPGSAEYERTQFEFGE